MPTNYPMSLTETSTVTVTQRMPNLIHEGSTITDTFALRSWRLSLTERSVVRDTWSLVGNELASGRYRR